MDFQPSESFGSQPTLLPLGDPSSRAMEVIRSLDSRSFGFLDFQTPSPDQTSAESSSTSFVSKDFIQQGIAKLCRDLTAGPQSDTFRAEVYCQLGHLHLLLEEYSAALSAYQQYQALSPLESSRNANMQYGLGLIYFNINSYNWAVQSFNEVLNLAPEFARRGEIHLRLGVMFKTKGLYNSSISNFKKATQLSGPASFSKLEIKFHLGHIYHLQGRFTEAKETFESILAKKNVPNPIKAMALRQLGWLYHSVPEVAVMTENPSAKAVDLLKLAVGADPSSSQAWYFLGRCHATQGRAREAFLSYQQAVNKATSNQAEIWCSIGILYHNMGQAKDSLQSYMCAVYFDPTRHEAWTDMGCLYESVSQPVDALIAYKNAVIIRHTDHVNVDKTGQYLFSRVANLEQYINMVSAGRLQSQPHTLPCIKEAWQSLVPSHIKTLAKKTASTSHTPLLDLSSLHSSPITPHAPLSPLPNFVPSFGNYGNIALGPAPKRQRTSRHNKEPIVIRNMSETWQSPSLSNGLPRGLEQAGVPVNIGDPSLKEHEILAQPNTFTGSTVGGTFSSGGSQNGAYLDPFSVGQKRTHDAVSLNGLSPFQSAQSPSSISSTQLSLNSQNGFNPLSTDFINPLNPLASPTYQHLHPPSATATNDLPGDLSSIPPLQLSSDVRLSEDDFREYLQSSSSQESIQTQSISDLLKSPTSQVPRRGSSQMVASYLKELSHSESLNGSVGSPAALKIAEGLVIEPSKSCETHSDSSSGVSSTDTKFSPTSPLLSPSLTIQHSPAYLEDSSDEFDELLDPIHQPFPSLGDAGEYMSHSPDLAPPEPPETKDRQGLSPEVPIFEVSSQQEALSEHLHGLCCNPDTPVCMIRGLCSVLNLDLSLFSSKSIVKSCPEHEMEVREQVQQAADENLDSNSRKQVWRCESSRTYTTVREYARYQKQVLQKQPKSGESKIGSCRKTIRFGTNIDLSDWSKWSTQLEELDKLPKFLRVSCPEANLLTHIGYSILGVNSAQLYMKVPGSRTPGHQENHNLCSVNINIGPGGCEWFSVHNKYWGVFHKLCDKHKLCFLTGSWWPILEELKELKVPVYRFIQQPGDVVWLNPGTVHWVQANTVCNNIAWNVGPITAHQFRMAWERYMWNRVRNVRSIVPMIHLSWNLAKKVKITDETLYQELKSLLESSLAQTHQLTAHLEKASIPLVPHYRLDNEPAPCCNQCLDEVFNILFVLSSKGEYLVYCHKCAMAMDESFTVLRQFNTDYLKTTLDAFRLHKKAISTQHIAAL